MSLEIRAGVGTGRANYRQDVATVQFFLGVTIDGVFGPISAGALAAFQTAKFGFTDGFADPCDITFKRLRGPLTDSDSALSRALVLNALGETALGAAATQEVASADGLGLVTTWAQGDGIAKIYSHPIWGTWDVRGLILSRYLELDEERGALGMPISGERDHGNSGGRISYFEHGRIIFEPPSSVIETIVPE